MTACTTVHGSEKEAVGEYRGFKAYVRFNPVSNEFTMSLKNESTVTFPLGNDIYGNITRMDNALAGLPNMKTKYENDLDTLEKNAANTKAQIEKPFDRLDELHEKEHRLEKLNAALSVSDGDKSSENSKPEKTAKKKDEVCL